MPTHTVGCPHCGSQAELSTRNTERITEVKERRSFFDVLLAFQGTRVETIECPDGHEFCVYVE